MTLWSTQPLTEMSTRCLPGSKGLLASEAYNLTAIYEPIIWKCGSLDVSQTYGPSRPVRGIVLSFSPFLKVFFILYVFRDKYLGEKLQNRYFMREFPNLFKFTMMVCSLQVFNSNLKDVYCNVFLRPPLWSSGQSSWLQIQRSRVRFPHYQIFFWEVGGLERGLLSLVMITEQLFQGNSGSGLENRNCRLWGNCCADHATPSIR
jgi:hypothetical protein